MFFPEGQVRVFLYGQPVNMRLSFEGLYALAKHVMRKRRLQAVGKLFHLQGARPVARLFDGGVEHAFQPDAPKRLDLG